LGSRPYLLGAVTIFTLRRNNQRWLPLLLSSPFFPRLSKKSYSISDTVSLLVVVGRGSRPFFEFVISKAWERLVESVLPCRRCALTFFFFVTGPPHAPGRLCSLHSSWRPHGPHCQTPTPSSTLLCVPPFYSLSVAGIPVRIRRPRFLFLPQLGSSRQNS